MAGYQWTKTKPTTAGWYWFHGPAHEAGQFQWSACYPFSMEPQ